MDNNFAERIRKIEDYNDVINCFDRFLQYLALQHKAGVLECFAMDKEDVSCEYSKSGKFIGPQAVSDYFECLPRMAARPGIMSEQHCVSPVVEFAGDRKTAKLTCMSAGMKVIAPARTQAWSWGKFYADFIQTDTGWKIWHLHFLPTFEADMERGPLHTQYTR